MAGSAAKSVHHTARARMLVKICGVRSLEAAQRAVAAGADFIGVICVPNRKRTVDLDVAREISEYLRSLPPRSGARPRLVGVFRNQTLDEIRAVQARAGLDVVQLHGSEPLELVREIGGPVIRRIVPGTPGFVAAGVAAAQVPDALVLVDGEQGGDGKPVDWAALGDLARAGVRYILAGGLTPENVRAAAAQPGCIGVDVSGGVEHASGEKDLAKIDAFVAAARLA